uniref:Uncharacterized protein n=2 Tax=Glossina palpalis gambiensis TaxID=67801 RepID=A0A1B0C517_9MUSC
MEKKFLVFCTKFQQVILYSNGHNRAEIVKHKYINFTTYDLYFNSFSLRLPYQKMKRAYKSRSRFYSNTLTSHTSDAMNWIGYSTEGLADNESLGRCTMLPNCIALSLITSVACVLIKKSMPKAATSSRTINVAPSITPLINSPPMATLATMDDLSTRNFRDSGRSRVRSPPRVGNCFYITIVLAQ